jgi:predicted Rossmann fold nucleotide-binding protein DprA/Smf involved in DNA uptake
MTPTFTRAKNLAEMLIEEITAQKKSIDVATADVKSAVQAAVKNNLAAGKFTELVPTELQAQLNSFNADLQVLASLTDIAIQLTDVFSPEQREAITSVRKQPKTRVVQGSNQEKLFEFIRANEGLPVAIGDIAKSTGLDLNYCSARLFQLSNDGRLSREATSRRGVYIFRIATTTAA